MPLTPLALRRAPCEALACLAEEPGAFLLEVPDPEHPATLLGCQPVAELRVERAQHEPLDAIARFVADGPAANAGLPFPFCGGTVACLTYELGVRLAPRAIPSSIEAPLAVLRRYDPLLIFDHRRMQWMLLSGIAGTQ